MNAKANPKSVRRPPAPGGAPKRRYPQRSATLPTGETLVLRPTGSIDVLDPAGAVTRTCEPQDPEWALHAIRFGLRPTPATVRPDGRNTRRGSPPG
jgi:hypothetical protein